MVVTPSDELAARIRLLTMQGVIRKVSETPDADNWTYDVVEPGFKYNLTDIQAAIGIHQLRKLGQFQAERQAVAQRYNEEFRDVPELELPPAATHGLHGWHLYIIKLRLERLQINRAEFIRLLRKDNIECGVHFIPIQSLRFFAPFAAAAACPNSMDLYPRMASLPLYPGMREDQIRRVIVSVKDTIERNRKTARAYMTGN